MKVKGVFGPPGTGKTTFLVNEAEKLAFGGDGVLYLSYTKAGALEAASRVNSSKIKASTIHSLAFNQLNLAKAAIIDKNKLTEFSKETGFPFKGTEGGSDEIQEGDEYLAVLSYAANTTIRGDIAYDHFGCPGTWHRFNMFAESYNNWKKAYGYMDFDDMLKYFITHVPSGSLGFKYVILDEAQDCSNLQWQAFEHMLGKDCSVLIAGDDDQAIYEWNGANPHGMVRFLSKHKGQVHVLDQSHRIPHSVHDLAHDRVLVHIKERVEKVFNPRPVEGEVTWYGDFNNVDPRSLYDRDEVMILTRDKWRQEEIKTALNREMIPYQVAGGHSPWTSKIANQLRLGESINWNSSNIQWRDFYSQADLSLPIKITLSTIHQAKGRESKCVVLDLNLPNRVLLSIYNDRDAELRVMYVGLTRASEELILCGGNPLI